MANDQELKYKITTEANVSGANAAAEAIGKVDKAAAGTAKSAGDAAKNLNQTGEVAEKLRAGSQVVGQVLSGNLRALAQFPAVLKAIGAATIANPLFALGTVLGLVIVPALQKLKEGWAAAGKAAEEAGKRSAEALSAAATEGVERRNNAVAERFAEIARRAKEAETNIRAAIRAQIEEEDFAEAEQLALFEDEVQAKGLTPGQAALGRANIRRDSRQRRTRLELAGIDSGVTTLEEQAARAAEQLPVLDTNVAIAQRQLAAVQARSPDRIRGELKLESQRLLSLQLDRAAAPQVGGDLAKIEADLAVVSQRRAGLQLELEKAEREHAAQLEAATANLKAADAARVSGVKSAGDLARAAADAELAAQRERGLVLGRAASAEQGETIETNRALRAEGLPGRALGDRFAQPQVRAREEQILGQNAAKLEPINTEQAVGGIITLGERFVAVQGLNRQEFARLDQAIKATSEKFQRELEATKSRLENLANAQR